MSRQKRLSRKATPKKMATNKSPAKKRRIEVAAPIGRQRKLLLRLSVEEYAALQAKAAKLGTSMANLLRTSALS